MTKETPGLRREYLYPIYGREHVQSDYDIERAALNATPNQLSLVMPWSKEVYAANLLLIKSVYVLRPGNALYSFEFGLLRGFQHGDPVRDKSLRIEAYDAADHKFTFVFFSKSGPNGGLKQADIDRVLTTFRPES
jgi:hypothetical protein